MRKEITASGESLPSAEEQSRKLYGMGFRVTESGEREFNFDKNTWDKLSSTSEWCLNLYNIYTRSPLLSYQASDEQGDQDKILGCLGLSSASAQELLEAKKVAVNLIHASRDHWRTDTSISASEKEEGRQNLRQYLIQQSMRDVWGDVHCYLSIAQAGGKPWEKDSIPPDMKVAVVSAITEKGISLPSRALADDYFTVMGRDPEITYAVLKDILKKGHIPFDIRVEVEAFIDRCKAQYPELIDQVFEEEVVAKNPTKVGFWKGNVLANFGLRYVEQWADKRYPDRNTDLQELLDYLKAVKTMGEKNVDVNDDGTAIMDEDGKVVALPPPLFRDGDDRWKILTEKNLTRALQELDRDILYYQNMLTDLQMRKEHLVDLAGKS